MISKSLIISSGDPAGCGPEITVRAIEELQRKDVNFIVVGDQKIFAKIAEYRRIKAKIEFIDLNTPGIGKLKKGCPSLLCGQTALNYLNRALEVARFKKIKRLVTAPLSKEAVQLVYRNFSGHTEYLRDYFKVSEVAMMMVSSQLKTVLLTRHQPLAEVSSLLNRKLIKGTLSLVQSSLKKQFKIKKPRIAFASFNPHSGINTFLKSEEKKILAVIDKFKSGVYGPYPADSLFTKSNLDKYDCIICPYHDQAMIPFKLLAMKEGVNLTLGLPILRTSPAHGVAYDIIRAKKSPFHSSMSEAINLALKLSP